jgi:hypothetical protein
MPRLENFAHDYLPGVGRGPFVGLGSRPKHGDINQHRGEGAERHCQGKKSARLFQYSFHDQLLTDDRDGTSSRTSLSTSFSRLLNRTSGIMEITLNTPPIVPSASLILIVPTG